MVCIGAIFLYLSNVVLVIPTINLTVTYVMCNVSLPYF